MFITKVFISFINVISVIVFKTCSLINNNYFNLIYYNNNYLKFLKFRYGQLLYCVKWS